jgi:hypothetical protein
MYVLPMEKHELELVTSTCTMSCNVLLHDYTRRAYDQLRPFNDAVLPTG